MPEVRRGCGDGYAAVLFDRDGTLVRDVPYNGDPAAVTPMPGARDAVAALRAAGLRLGVVSNQSGVARGLVTEEQVRRVNARVAQLLGPFDVWCVCPHGPADGCDCRKPRPGLVLAAARRLGLPPTRCVVVGDIGSDVVAADRAGAAGVLVPTPVTRSDEIAAAPVVCRDVAEAATWILARRPRPRVGPRLLVVRSDSQGDVLVCGPAVRAMAATAGHLTLLCGPRGRASAELLPGVDELLEWQVPWIDPAPPPVVRPDVARLVGELSRRSFAEAVILTSPHQSALPLALLLRLAGVPRISAISGDYPGALLDVRHRVPAGTPEPERALSLAAAAGCPLPPGDDGRLAIRREPPDMGELVGDGPYVVVHPGASVPARACPPSRCAEIVAALTRSGRRVVVTGGAAERELTAAVAAAGRDAALDLGGRVTWRELAGVLAGASCVVVGNTGPAHLAAAVGTPVVSLYAPTVPFRQWAPYRVPTVRLGTPHAPCRGTRATVCPVPGHPCLGDIDPGDVVAAVDRLAPLAATAPVSGFPPGRTPRPAPRRR